MDGSFSLREPRGLALRILRLITHTPIAFLCQVLYHNVRLYTNIVYRYVLHVTEALRPPIRVMSPTSPRPLLSSYPCPITCPRHVPGARQRRLQCRHRPVERSICQCPARVRCISCSTVKVNTIEKLLTCIVIISRMRAMRSRCLRNRCLHTA